MSPPYTHRFTLTGIGRKSRRIRLCLRRPKPDATLHRFWTDIAGPDPSASIGVNKFFELAVATAIVLVGFGLGTALGAVVENVQRRYSLEQWSMLQAGKAAQGIYNELTCLDLEVVRMDMTFQPAYR